MWIVIKLFASKYWKELVVGGLIFTMLVCGWLYYSSLKNTIADQADVIVKLNVANALLDSNNKSLVEAIGETNKSLALIAQSTDDTRKSFVTLNQSINKQRADLDKKLQGILDEKKPE